MNTQAPAPYAHQIESVDKFRDLYRTFDASDPGTGKTRVVLELIRERGHAALVICPKTLMETAWVDDAAKFTPELSVLPIYAGPKREQLARLPADILIFNTDAVKWLALQSKMWFERFDIIIIDEISAFKHHTSKRSKYLAKIVKYFDYRHGMTGTPNPNRITDIHNQIKLIDDGKALGDSFYAFRHVTSTPVQTGFLPQHRSWVDKPGAPEQVAGLLTAFTARNEFDKCIDIPPNVVRHVNVRLKPKHRAHYEKFQKKALLDLKDNQIKGLNAAAAATKLLQISSGAVYTANGSEDPVMVFDTERYDTIAQLVSDRLYTIVFFLWSHQRDELIKALEKQGINDYAVIDGSITKGRADIIRNFQDGQYRTLLLHPRSAAHGITLTRATAVIWASPTYDAEWWKQGYHRIVRAGQQNKTETILVSAKNTIDKRVYDTMEGKKRNMSSFLSILVGACNEMDISNE